MYRTETGAICQKCAIIEKVSRQSRRGAEPNR
jgi:hypothetical protein